MPCNKQHCQKRRTSQCRLGFNTVSSKGAKPSSEELVGKPQFTRFTTRFSHGFPMGFPWKLVTKRHGGGGELFLHQWTQAIQHYLHNFTTVIAMLMLETTSARCEASHIFKVHQEIWRIRKVIIQKSRYIYIYIYLYLLTFNVIQPALINYSFQAPPSWGQADL